MAGSSEIWRLTFVALPVARAAGNPFAISAHANQISAVSTWPIWQTESLPLGHDIHYRIAAVYARFEWFSIILYIRVCSCGCGTGFSLWVFSFWVSWVLIFRFLIICQGLPSALTYISLISLTLTALTMRTGTPMDIFYTALHLIVSIIRVLGTETENWTSISGAAEWQLHANAINLDMRLEASMAASSSSLVC